MWANKYSSATAQIFMGKQLETPEAAEDTLNHKLQETEEGKYVLNVREKLYFALFVCEERQGAEVLILFWIYQEELINSSDNRPSE